MDTTHDRRSGASVAPVLAPLLLAAGVAALGAGRFIQFDDDSGFGSDRWIMPWAAVVAVLAGAALVVGLSHPVARRRLGMAVAALAAVTILLAWQVEGFRFVFKGGEGELNMLLAALALTALWLLPRTYLVRSPGRDGRTHRRPGAGTRLAVYGSLLVAAPVVMFFVGAGIAERGCDVEVDGCGLPLLEGLIWALAAAAVVVVAGVVSEVVLASRRRWSAAS
ncbi:hypothetical protein [Nocardioides sp.]|uniref:hypothetical protein n=1 Tax=Nocardioides sp. TaxID=35761 RepID=UPI0035146803